LLIDEEPDRLSCPRPGFRQFLPDHHSAPIWDDEPPTHSSPGGKLALGHLFNFKNRHWVEMYEESAKKSFDEELALYDLLNEDAGTGDGMEVDVDETTADILTG
jgi:hypothetical protein